MDNSEKIIQEILASTAQKNGVSCVLTFSLASKLFSEAYSNLTQDELNNIKLSPDWVETACSLVESLYDKKFKQNKKDLVIQILRACLEKKKTGFTPDELKILDIIIESAHSNGRIKKIAMKKQIGSKVLHFFLSFFQ
jgi:aryl-alcohol dehydrogenase-like predicted oxidoreductase